MNPLTGIQTQINQESSFFSRSNKYSLVQYKGNPFQELNNFAKTRDGVTQLYKNEVLEFESNLIVAGHDATHPLVSSLLDTLNIHYSTQGSPINECLTIGISLSTVDEFNSDFTMSKQDYNAQKSRIKYLLERKDITNQLEKHFEIFDTALSLGKELKSSNFGQSLDEVYLDHKAWYYNPELIEYTLTSEQIEATFITPEIMKLITTLNELLT